MLVVNCKSQNLIVNVSYYLENDLWKKFGTVTIYITHKFNNIIRLIHFNQVSFCSFRWLIEWVVKFMNFFFSREIKLLSYELSLSCYVEMYFVFVYICFPVHYVYFYWFLYRNCQFEYYWYFNHFIFITFLFD